MSCMDSKLEPCWETPAVHNLVFLQFTLIDTSSKFWNLKLTTVLISHNFLFRRCHHSCTGIVSNKWLENDKLLNFTLPFNSLCVMNSVLACFYPRARKNTNNCSDNVSNVWIFRMDWIAEDLTTKMRIQWGKMGFSRCTPSTIRCATKTGVLANIIQAVTWRESTSTHGSITCDCPLSPMVF